MFINLTPEQAAKIEAEMMKPGGVVWLPADEVMAFMPAPKKPPRKGNHRGSKA
jgi:hypothetical protein